MNDKNGIADQALSLYQYSQQCKRLLSLNNNNTGHKTHVEFVSLDDFGRRIVNVVVGLVVLVPLKSLFFIGCEMNKL